MSFGANFVFFHFFLLSLWDRFQWLWYTLTLNCLADSKQSYLSEKYIQASLSIPRIASSDRGKYPHTINSPLNITGFSQYHFLFLERIKEKKNLTSFIINRFFMTISSLPITFVFSSTFFAVSFNFPLQYLQTNPQSMLQFVFSQLLNLAYSGVTYPDYSDIWIYVLSFIVCKTVSQFDTLT